MIKDILIIANIVLIEAIMSVDNAAVLALMVKHLPKEQQKKALRYGILGAYVLRGVCLLVASVLLKFMFLKVLGGVYLLYLALKYFLGSEESEKQENSKWHKGFIGTIVMVELMDLAFSIDNIFAVVAMTSSIYLIIFGVFIGILAMRFVAQGFVKILHQYPDLEKSAYIVIFYLGAKLIHDGLGFKTGLVPFISISDHTADMMSTIFTFSIFLYPILKDYVRGHFLSGKSQQNQDGL